MDKLVDVNEDNERLLDNTRQIADALGPRLFPPAVVATQGNERVADALADGALGVPPPPLVSLEFLTDKEKRNRVAKRLLGVALLGRRVGARLLQRAAWQTERTTVLPERARAFFADANAAPADRVNVDKPSNNKGED